RGDEHGTGIGDLIGRRAADLAHGLGDTVHAVDVGLPQLSAVRVQGQVTVEADPAVGDEVLRLAARAEAEFLELHQHVRGEVVVQHGDVHIGRSAAGVPPQLPA